MDDHSSPRDALLREIALRFRDSASVMRDIARRVQEAARASQRNDRNAIAAGAGLSEEVGAGPARGMAFSYLEFLEFSGASEFERYRHMPPVTHQDIASAEWETLARQLLDL